MTQQSEETKAALMQRNIEIISVTVDEIKKDVKEIRQENAQHFVTKEEFELVKKIVYGLVGLILVGITTAGLNALINR